MAVKMVRRSGFQLEFGGKTGRTWGTGLGMRSGGVLPAGDRGDRTGEDQGRPDGDDEDCIWTRLCEGAGYPV